MRSFPFRALTAGAAGVLLAVAAAAGTVNETGGLALKGYDPVAYFTLGKPVPGSPRFRATHEGASYRFATAAHRDSFRANPGRYAPAYGGFCAFGTSRGYKADVDPAAFTIADGRLFLNYNAEVRSKWSEDVPGYVRLADEKWPEVAKTTRVHR